jgi:methyl-accepting chemotaxis protein
MKRTWKRRNYFIKKELQGRYIFSFFIFVICGGIIFTLIFSLLSANTLTVVYEDYSLRIGKTPFILIREILSADWIFIVTAGLSVVVISMFLTHRFAGPMYRFEKSVEEMLRGNFDFEIRLRKKDEGKELAAVMNQLISRISSNFREMRDLTDAIELKLKDASESVGHIEPGKEASLALTEARDLTGRLRGILHAHKIKNDS